MLQRIIGTNHWIRCHVAVDSSGRPCRGLLQQLLWPAAALAAAAAAGRQALTSQVATHSSPLTHSSLEHQAESTSASSCQQLHRALRLIKESSLGAAPARLAPQQPQAFILGCGQPSIPRGRQPCQERPQPVPHTPQLAHTLSPEFPAHDQHMTAASAWFSTRRQWVAVLGSVLAGTQRCRSHWYSAPQCTVYKSPATSDQPPVQTVSHRKATQCVLYTSSLISDPSVQCHSASHVWPPATAKKKVTAYSSQRQPHPYSVSAAMCVNSCKWQLQAVAAGSTRQAAGTLCPTGLLKRLSGQRSCQVGPGPGTQHTATLARQLACRPGHLPACCSVHHCNSTQQYSGKKDTSGHTSVYTAVHSSARHSRCRRAGSSCPSRTADPCPPERHPCGHGQHHRASHDAH